MESRKRRLRRSESPQEEMSMSTSFEESNKGFDNGDDDEDISIIDEQMLLKLDEGEIEELSSITGVRQQKQPEKANVSVGTAEVQTESTCWSAD